MTVPARAAQGRLRGQDWVAGLQPSSARQARGTPETCIDTQHPPVVEVPPQGQASPAVLLIIWLFPSVSYFWMLPSGPVIMMLDFELSARRSEYS